MKSIRLLFILTLVFFFTAVASQASYMDPARKLMHTEYGLTINESFVQTEPAITLENNKIPFNTKVFIHVRGATGFAVGADGMIHPRVSMDFLDEKGTPLPNTETQTFDINPLKLAPEETVRLNGSFNVTSQYFKEGQNYLVRIRFEDKNSPKSVLTFLEFTPDNSYKHPAVLNESKISWKNDKIIAISNGKLKANQLALWENDKIIAEPLVGTGTQFEVGLRQFEGFTNEGGKLYPGCILEVYGANGTKLGSLGDLYKDDKEGVATDGSMQVYVNINSMFESGKDYFVILTIWDKKVSSTDRIYVSVPFRIK